MMSNPEIQDGDVVMFAEGTWLYYGEGKRVTAGCGTCGTWTVADYDSTDVCVCCAGYLYIGSRARIATVTRNDVQIYPPPEPTIRDRLISILRGECETATWLADLLFEHFDIKVKGKP